MTDSGGTVARVMMRIRGRVQGVGFRFSAVAQARDLGLNGWVRNTADGDVELLAEGPEDRVRRLVSWCHDGPRGALVTDVEEQWLTASGGIDGFHIRY